MQKESFDLRVEVRDKKGTITKYQPYRLHIIDKQRYFERPPNSGLFFYENNKIVPVEELPSQLKDKSAAVKSDSGSKVETDAFLHSAEKAATQLKNKGK